MQSFDPTNPAGREPEEFLDMSWEMFGELCRALALRVARDYQPEAVIGIARTGAIPGAIVACILGVEFHAITISRTDDDEVVRDRPSVFSQVPAEVGGKRVLIVDEIATSGDTIRVALAAVRGVGPAEVRTATSFVRPRAYRPDFHALETAATIVFPWDRKVFDGDDLVVNPRYDGMVDE
jgi:uncharacterized protein